MEAIINVKSSLIDWLTDWLIDWMTVKLVYHCYQSMNLTDFDTEESGLMWVVN